MCCVAEIAIEEHANQLCTLRGDSPNTNTNTGRDSQYGR